MDASPRGLTTAWWARVWRTTSGGESSLRWDALYPCSRQLMGGEMMREWVVGDAKESPRRRETRHARTSREEKRDDRRKPYSRKRRPDGVAELRK